MSVYITTGLEAWLAARQLSELIDGIVAAGFGALEALLLAEDSTLSASAQKLGFHGPTFKRLLAELEALRHPPLPAVVRQRLVELGPCQLLNLAAILEPIPDGRSSDANTSSQKSICSMARSTVFDQFGLQRQLVERLSARLDAQQWPGLSRDVNSRKWHFELTPSLVQPVLMPSFAQFEPMSDVLLSASEAGPWCEWEEWQQLVTSGLQQKQPSVFQLVALTGAVSMASQPKPDNLDSEALDLAQEHGFQAFVDKLVFGVFGQVEFYAGEFRCKVSLGPVVATKVALCKGSSLESMLDGVRKVARNASRSFYQHWQVFRVVTKEISKLVDCRLQTEVAEVHSDGHSQSLGFACDDEVQLLQMYSINLAGKFSGSMEEELKTIESGLIELATGFEKDSGKQVRVAVQNLTPNSAFIHLVLLSAELAEVERRLVYREFKGVAGAERRAQVHLNHDVREAFGLAAPAPKPKGNAPNSARLPPVGLRFERSTTQGSNMSETSLPHSARVRSKTCDLDAPKTLSDLSTAAAVKARRSLPNRTSSKHSVLPPVDTAKSSLALCNSLNRTPLAEMEATKVETQVAILATKVFRSLDFDNSLCICAAKLNWGFDHVASIFEIACPDFGPSGFESSEVTGNHAHAYFTFLDENGEGVILEEQFVKYFTKAEEIRRGCSKQLEEALQLCCNQLERKLRNGVVLCTSDGSLQALATGGQQVELMYSVLQTRSAKIKSYFKCTTSLGPRAVIALVPADKTINSFELLISCALCLVQLDNKDSAGHATMAIPSSKVLQRECNQLAFRLYIASPSGSDREGASFMQAGDELPCMIFGPPSIVTMGTNINQALASASVGNAMANSVRREATHSLLESISSHELKPDLAITVRRQLLPRLQQSLLSPSTLHEKDLVPAALLPVTISNAGAGSIVPAEEGPCLEWLVVDASHLYLLMLVMEKNKNLPENPGVGATLCFTYSLNEVKTRYEEGCQYAYITIPHIPPGYFLCYIKAKGKPGYGAWSECSCFHAVSAKYVSLLETGLHQALSSKEVDDLDHSIAEAEKVWMVDELLLNQSRDQFLACHAEARIRSAIRINEIDELTGAAENASKVEKCDQHLLQQCWKHLGALHATHLREDMVLSETTIDSIEKTVSVLHGIPYHDEQTTLERAAIIIEAKKCEPELRELMSNGPLIDLIPKYIKALPFAEVVGERWHELLAEIRACMVHMAEESLEIASNSDDIAALSDAITNAHALSEALKIERKTAGSWHGASVVVVSFPILEKAKQRLAALRELGSAVETKVDDELDEDSEHAQEQVSLEARYGEESKS